MIDAILGLDVGTTSTKAVLFDVNGAELARSISRPYRNEMPHPGWVEQDPQKLWHAVLDTIRHTIAQAAEDVSVRALGMAAQSGSLLPAAASGEPVYPLITWMDGRTEELVRHWQSRGLQKQVKAVSGWSLYPGLPLPSIAWLRRHDPQTFAAAKHYFSVNDFLAHRLTGRRANNPSNGGGMQLVDIHSGAWSDWLCSLAGISVAQLSPMLPAGSVIGELLPDICRATGIAQGALLVNGGHDQVCTALALGVNEPGKLLLACGTAWVITGITDPMNLEHVPSTLDLNFHALEDRYTISQSLGGLGASLEWWLNQAYFCFDCRSTRADMLASMEIELAQMQPGTSLFFLPLTGGHDNPATTRSGGFVGLQLSHSRADMARAVMESAAFELRWALESIRQAGLPVELLWMVGGAANSASWPSILADVTMVPINLPQYDNWPALGAAVLAGTGIGAFAGVEEALANFQMPVKEVLPDGRRGAIYDEAYSHYKEARKRNGGR